MIKNQTNASGSLPQPILPTGTRVLTNQQARAIAEALFREHWATYDPLACRFIAINYKRIFEREFKSHQVRHQQERAERQN